VIAWPDRGGSWFHWKGGGLAPFIAENAETLREVQGDVSKFILAPDVRFDADPIALYYSHPSIQASWVMDVVPHGGSWPNRSSSLDNGNQTAARNRVAWMKILEDCGYQYNVVTSDQVAAGALEKERYRVLILDRTIAMSDAEAAAIRRFVAQGGTVIADHLTGVLDEHGKGRPKGALDDLFGIQRDESKGYLGGKSIFEINGELYQKPFLTRLSYDGALRLRQTEIVIYERGTRGSGSSQEEPVTTMVRQGSGGAAAYLNLTPVAYNDLGERLGRLGEAWRRIVLNFVAGSGRPTDVLPRAQVLSGGKPVPLAEMLFWRKGDTLVLALVRNLPRDASTDDAGTMQGMFGEPLDVEISLARPVTNVRNLRTGEQLPDGAAIRAKWKPWEALLFEVASPAP